MLTKYLYLTITTWYFLIKQFGFSQQPLSQNNHCRLFLAKYLDGFVGMCFYIEYMSLV